MVKPLFKKNEYVHLLLSGNSIIKFRVVEVLKEKRQYRIKEWIKEQNPYTIFPTKITFRKAHRLFKSAKTYMLLYE